MKFTKTILALGGLFLLTTALAFGQTKEKLTQAEEFGAQAGTLIEKQFIDIGKVKGVKVRVNIFKDLNSGISESALRFEYLDTKIATLDTDEIDGLIKSIKNLLTNVFPTTREIYTEITYRSKSGFEAGAYYSIEKGKWITYLQIEGWDRGSMVFLTPEDFSTLLELLEQAKLKM